MKYAHGEYASASKEHINKYKMAHCIGVAEYMRDNAWKYGEDKNKMYAIGLLHDIGYLEGRKDHEATSYEILDSLGMSEDILFAIVNHGKNPYEVEDAFQKNLLKECPVLVLLYEADMSVNAQGYKVGFDKRLQDIGDRYGYDHIAYETASNTVKFVKEKHKELGLHKGKKGAEHEEVR